MISIWRRSPRVCWRLCREAAEQAAVSSRPEVVAAEGQTGRWAEGEQGGLGALEMELKGLAVSLGSVGVWRQREASRAPSAFIPGRWRHPDGHGSTGWDV